MKINVKYYEIWVAWAVATMLKLSTPRSPRLPEFLSDLSVIYLWWPRFFAGLPKGSGIKLYLNIIKYIANHPDPLEDLRNKMEAMQVKWGGLA